MSHSTPRSDLEKLGDEEIKLLEFIKSHYGFNEIFSIKDLSDKTRLGYLRTAMIVSRLVKKGYLEAVEAVEDKITTPCSTCLLRYFCPGSRISREIGVNYKLRRDRFS